MFFVCGVLIQLKMRMEKAYNFKPPSGFKKFEDHLNLYCFKNYVLDDAVLAEELGFSTQFLLSLTKSCRGLIETLPLSVVEKSFIGYISVK
jgi:hypothetical protein